MNVFLVSDVDATTDRVRKILNGEGVECPAANVVSFARAASRLVQNAADLVIAVLPQEPEQAIQALDLLANVERHSGMRVLGVGPAADSKLVIRALRGLIDDYLDEADLDAELRSALDRWKRVRTAHEGLGRVLAVLAPSGGSGSSTLAVNVATVLAKEHGKALLLDLKLATGDLAALLDLKPTHTLADFCQSGARMDRTLFESLLVRHDSGVHLLAPPRHLADVVRVTPEGVRRALEMATALFPYVVVDLDHSFSEEQLQVLPKANVILVVLRLDFVSLRNVRRTLEHLENLGIPRDRIQLVANRYGQPKEVPYAKVEEALGARIAHFIPDDPWTINRANNNGVPVVLEAPSAKVSKSVTKLANSVNGQHRGPK
jgi:pilus assembly protein CpaE